MYKTLEPVLTAELNEIKEAGLFKTERIISTPQAADIKANGKEVINFCANNYLGLANNHDLIEVAKKSLDHYGLGTASVRFICGTFDLHKNFEKKLAEFLGFEDIIT